MGEGVRVFQPVAQGAVLFTRSAPGLMPTDAVRAALPLAEDMQASARALERALSARDGPLSGRVRVTASLVMSQEVLPDLVASLAARFSGLTVELSASNTVENLRRRDADFALRVTAPLQQGLVARKLGEVGLGLIAAPASVARHGQPRTAADLAGHALVGGDRDRALQAAMAAAGVDTGRLRDVLRCDNDAVQLAMVRAGAGIGASQLPLAARHRLVRLLSEFRAALPLWLVMHEDLRAVSRVRAVFDHLGAGLSSWLRAG